MGVFKLGKMTFGSLFKKPETIQYPFQEKPKPEGLKGQIVIDVDDCILCGMCDRSCSTDCITVDKANSLWEIDRYACVQCGYCVTVCPMKCLHMAPDYAAAATTRDPERFTVPKAEAAKPAAKDKQAKAPAAGQAFAAKPETASAPEAGEQEQDAQLEALLALMDAESAQRARAALER